MKHYGDITKLNGAELPVVDVITGGSPCQDLVSCWTDAPMVEYAPIVRCKECKWWINGMCYSDNFILRFEEVKPDWFCADGVRKEQEE